MKTTASLTNFLTSLFLGVSLMACNQPSSDNGGDNPPPSNNGPQKNTEWSQEEEIVITGWTGGNAQEPHLSLNEQYLFFNNRPANGVLQMHYAVKVTATRYQYMGTIGGANETTSLNGTPAVDDAYNFYWISTRLYDTNQDTVFGGVFNTSSNTVTGAAQIGQNITDTGAGNITMGIDVSRDGLFMFLSRAHFPSSNSHPDHADLDLAFKSAGVWHRVAKAQVDVLFLNVNTNQYLEYATSMSNDGLELYFTRAHDMNDASSLKIMVAKRAAGDASFGKPEEIAAIQGEITEAPCLSADERFLYYHKKSGEFTKIFRVRR